MGLSIGIVGGGNVGRATARCWMEHADVCVFDVDSKRGTHALAETVDSDLTFVCLPTPEGTDGRADLDHVYAFFAGMAGAANNLVLKSTVPVGTTRFLAATYGLPNLCYSPEFLTERCAVADANLPARNIVGDPRSPIPDNNASRLLDRLYSSRFPGAGLLRMTSDEAEAVKCLTNSFFAVKIGYFNEAYTFCEATGLDWRRVQGGVLSDGRIAHSHTRVPGPSGARGFGGGCLIKDSESTAKQMEDAGVKPEIIRAALSRNETDRRRPR